MIMELNRILAGAAVCGLAFVSTIMFPVSCSRFEKEPDVQTGQTGQDSGIDRPSGECYEDFFRIKVSEELAASLEKRAGTQGVIVPAKSETVLEGVTGIRYIKRTFRYAGKFEPRTRAMGMHLWYDIAFDASVPSTKSVPSLKDVKGVVKVEYRPVEHFPEQKAVPVPYPQTVQTRSEATEFFNDPRLGEQWHYYNDGTIQNSLKGSDIHVLPVWKEITTGSDNVIVSVVDGGIDIDHEDLYGNIWVNEAELNGQPGVDDDNNGFVDDINGYNFPMNKPEILATDHGTHVAGTIAAMNNNGTGVCGIAGGDASKGIKGVRLMSCQTGMGMFVSNTAEAMKYGADNGAVISQNSWGYGQGELQESDKLSIDYFVKYAGVDENGNQIGPMKGGIVIFAAGNDDKPLGNPGAYEKALAVASIDAKYEKAWYTNYGDWVDIAAPGGSEPNGTEVLSTIPMEEGGYGLMQGTSMACPHISGVAALLLSHFGGEGFTPEKLRDKITFTGRNIDSYNPDYKGQLATLVDTYAAFTETTSEIAPDPVVDFEISGASNRISLEFAIPSDADDGVPAGFTVFYSKTAFGSGLDRENLPDNVLSKRFMLDGQKSGDRFEILLEELDFETQYHVALESFDASSNRSALSAVKSVSTTTNALPVIEPEGVEFTIRNDEVKTFEFRYHDPDNHKTSWYLRGGSIALSAEELTPGVVTVTCKGKMADMGTYRGELSATDIYSGRSVVEIVYTITGSRSPEVVKEFGNIVMAPGEVSARLALSDYFADGDDGDSLAFSAVSASPQTAVAVVEDGMMEIRALSAGKTTIEVKAVDLDGNVAVSVISLLVSDSLDMEISAWPNPVRDTLNIVSARKRTLSYRFVSPLGNEVKSDMVRVFAGTPYKVNISDFPAGVYTLEVKDGDVSATRRIVKL